MWPTGDDCDDADDDVATKMKTSMMKSQIMMIMMRMKVSKVTLLLGEAFY